MIVIITYKNDNKIKIEGQNQSKKKIGQPGDDIWLTVSDHCHHQLPISRSYTIVSLT